MSSNGAIITGGASGVGLVLSKHLLAKGWHVVIVDINPAGVAIAKELGDKALWVETDISDWDSQVVMFGKAFSWYPHITLLAANAGISTDMTAPTGLLSPDAQKPPLRVLDVNLLGTIYSIKLFLHHIQKLDPSVLGDGTPKARVVITGSEGGLYALPPDPVYSASKHALVGLTRSLGPVYASTYGITVNSILPGFMPTPLIAPLIPITPVKYATPLTAIMRAYDALLSMNESGQTLETSGENMYYQKQQAYPDEVAKWVWDDGPAFWGPRWRIWERRDCRGEMDIS